MRPITIKKYKDSSDEYLSYEYQQSDESDNEIMEYLLYKYERYIHKIAGFYYNKTNLTNEDILAYARIGFMEGVKRYDSNRNGYFIYFTGQWMKTKILLAIDDFNRVVRFPVNKLKEFRKIQGYIITDNEENPNIEYLVDKTGLPLKKIYEYLFNNYSLFNINDFYNLRDDDVNISKKLDTDDLTHDLSNIINEFEESEQYIIIHSFGLFNNQMMDIFDIGEYLNISSERVRQIKNRCIRRLRHSSYTYILKQHLN